MFQNTAYHLAARILSSRAHRCVPKRLESLLWVAYFRGPSPLNMRQRAGGWLMCRRNLPLPLVSLAFRLMQD